MLSDVFNGGDLFLIILAAVVVATNFLYERRH
jgi:hypothetical protein